MKRRTTKKQATRRNRIRAQLSTRIYGAHTRWVALARIIERLRLKQPPEMRLTEVRTRGHELHLTFVRTLPGAIRDLTIEGRITV